jgi:microcystin-dependent protein
MLVPYNFPPKGFAFCAGQLMAISQNTALFSLLGTFYGGDGKSTFALPNLQGMHAIGAGQGPGLQTYDLGQTGGSENVTLITTEMPQHTHTVNGAKGAGSLPSPGADALSGAAVYSDAAANTQMNPQMLPIAGGSQPHNNMMPYLALNWIIALQGVFPARS